MIKLVDLLRNFYPDQEIELYIMALGITILGDCKNIEKYEPFHNHVVRTIVVKRDKDNVLQNVIKVLISN